MHPENLPRQTNRDRAYCIDTMREIADAKHAWVAYIALASLPDQRAVRSVIVGAKRGAGSWPIRGTRSRARDARCAAG